MNIHQNSFSERLKGAIWLTFQEFPVCHRGDGPDYRYKGKTTDNPGKVAVHVRRLGRHRAYLRCSLCGFCFSVSYHQLVKALRCYAKEYEEGAVGSGTPGVARRILDRANDIAMASLRDHRGRKRKSIKEDILWQVRSR